MLLDSIGAIFDQNFSTYLARFRVDDAGIIEPGTVTVRNELRVVLLVESPHTDEVHPPGIVDRYPLAGSVGRFVRNKLMRWGLTLPEQPTSIGQLVHQGCDTVQRLGIMNVSQLPFKERPYELYDNDVRQLQCWDDYITCMEYIRKHPGVKTYMSSNDNGRTRRWQVLRCKIDRLEHAIIEDLAVRLGALGENVRVMCLGAVAQIFYLKSRYYLETNGYILDFPYPSHSLPRRYWKELTPQNDPRLQGILGHIMPPPDDVVQET